MSAKPKNPKPKPTFNPQVWTLVRDGKPIKTCLVCADSVNFIGKLKTADGTQQYSKIIHLAAIDLSYFETARLKVGTFESEDGTWDIDTRLEKFFLTHDTASAALEMAYRFIHPKSKISPKTRTLVVQYDDNHSRDVAAKQTSSTIWKMKAFLCHVIWQREKLSIKQRIESLKRQGHTGIKEKAFTRAMEERGF